MMISPLKKIIPRRLGVLKAISSSLRIHRSCSSINSFQPPEPLPFNGLPVYDDITLTSPSPPTSLERNADTDAVFVVNGASRGIGLQYVKELLKRSRGKVVACMRHPECAEKMSTFLASCAPEVAARVTLHPLDVTNQAQIDALAAELTSRYNRVDALFNVAGLLGDGVTTPGPEKSMAQIDRAWLTTTFEVNTIGPMMLTKALTPLMKLDRRKNASNKRAETVVVNMSAKVGSLSDNGMGGWISYRMSKSALNQGTRTMAHELKRQGTWSIALHPGTTDTDLSVPFQKNVKKDRLFPVAFTVTRMLDVIDGMEAKHSGGFYDWAGRALPF